MSHRQIIRVLYMGGQAAILAELSVILGLLIFVLADRNLMMSQGGHQTVFDNYRVFLELVHRNHLVFSVGTVLLSTIPTALMLFVALAWHLYFQSEGIVIMHWMTTALAICGATMILLFGGTELLVMPIIAGEYHSGNVTYEQLFPSLVLFGAFYDLGTAILYGAYPMLLVVTSHHQKLLPRWFTIPALLMAFSNEMNLLFGYDLRVMSEIAMVATFLTPFFIGIVMLRKAQNLAVSDYAEKHGTPTPTAKTPVTE